MATKRTQTDEPTAVPMWRQYTQIKALHPTTILLFRLGDFYEAFDDDADVLGTALDTIVLKRHMGDRTMRVAGVPAVAIDAAIAKLIAAKHAVAVCDQVGTPFT